MPLKVAVAIVLMAVASAPAQDQKANKPNKETAIEEPDLRDELLDMEKEHVELRQSVIKQLGEKGIPFGGGKTITDPALVKELTEPTRKMNEMDRKHRTRLKEIVKKYGWPGKSLVGKEAAHAAWLIVQYADKDRPFQRRSLKLMKAAPKGEVETQDIAFLTDSILVADKKKQLYGTQLQVVKGAFKPRPIEDPANVDKRRAEMGMSGLADYLETAQAQYDNAAGLKK